MYNFTQANKYPEKRRKNAKISSQAHKPGNQTKDTVLKIRAYYGGAADRCVSLTVANELTEFDFVL